MNVNTIKFESTAITIIFRLLPYSMSGVAKICDPYKQQANGWYQPSTSIQVEKYRKNFSKSSTCSLLYIISRWVHTHKVAQLLFYNYVNFFSHCTAQLPHFFLWNIFNPRNMLEIVVFTSEIHQLEVALLIKKKLNTQYSCSELKATSTFGSICSYAVKFPLQHKMQNKNYARQRTDEQEALCEFCTGDQRL